MLGLYADVHQWNLSSINHTVTRNENRVAALGVESRLTRDIRSMFVSITSFYFKVQAGKLTVSHANNRANVR